MLNRYHVTNPPRLVCGSPEPSGLILVCSRDAVITRVVHDGLSLGAQLTVGSGFCSICAPESRPKCRKFLKAIKNRRREDNVPLNVLANGRTIRLLFSAFDRGGKLEIVGALTPAAAAEIRLKFLENDKNLESVSALPFPPQRSDNPGVRRRNRVKSNTVLESVSEKTPWILTATHDLRNQVNAIQAYTELLNDDVGLQSEQASMVEAIHTATEFMLHLLSDLEQFAWAESGDSWLRLAPMNLLPIIQESIALSRPAAEFKGTELELTCQEQALVINIDSERIRDVFLNLFDNAIKYSQNGAKVEVCVVPQRSQVLISVRDNGPGIRAADLDSLFAPFQRTHARAASRDPGTGLGLAICKRIVEQHSGRIWAESQFGEGATFHVVLPLMRAGLPGISSKSPESERDAPHHSQ